MRRVDTLPRSGYRIDMPNTSIEIPHIDLELLEQAYSRAIRKQEAHAYTWAEIGWRAAKAKDAKMLLVLEKCCEILDKMEEDQRGRTRRSTETVSHQVETTPTQLYKKSYETMDKGNPLENFKWIYGSAAWICGYNCAY